MGYYINQTRAGELLGANTKHLQLIADGAKEIPEPRAWREGIVCIVANGMFQACAYAFDQRELDVFKRDDGSWFPTELLNIQYHEEDKKG